MKTQHIDLSEFGVHGKGEPGSIFQHGPCVCWLGLPQRGSTAWGASTATCLSSLELQRLQAQDQGVSRVGFL